jgi:hypothetical protein
MLPSDTELSYADIITGASTSLCGIGRYCPDSVSSGVSDVS